MIPPSVSARVTSSRLNPQVTTTITTSAPTSGENDPQVEMIQGVNVGYHPVEQLTLAKARQPRRREGEQFAEGENAQVLQHAKGSVSG